MSFQNNFKVTFSPHIHSGNSAFKMYFAGVLSLLPAVFAVAYFFGLSGVLLLATTVSGSYLTDFSVNFLAYKKFNFKDTSAIFTGLLLAFFLPPTCPLWIAFAGAVFSILVAKIPFGGTGSSIFNVSLVGWAFIVLSFPQEMLNYKSILTDKTEIERKISDFDLPAHNVRRLGKILEISGVDSVSALPPQEVKERYIDFRENFFLGWKGGTLGDCAGILFLVGFLIMFYKRYFGWRAPFSFLSVLFFLSWFFTGEKGIASGHPTFYLFSGSTLVLAFYSCLDWPTTPITKKGRFYFGFFAGSLVFLTRTYGIFTEVGGFAILLVNCISPLLDKKGSVNPQFLKQFR